MKIFLSYGHDNAAEALVLRIKTDLAHLGHEVWLDRERIEFGDDWRREVTEGIIESDQVLAFLSEHSTRDPGVCRDEIAIALGAGKAYVFTILVQPEVYVSLPISVSHLQWLDMHDWQARQQADTDAFEVWYAERFAQICAVIDHPDNQRFAGEISQLEAYLLPLDCTPDINSRLQGFTGRQWLLDEINTWREGDRSSRIFCLSGGPGMGKSAVVAWLAHSNKAQVIAAQFCRYNSPERRDPTRVIRSIAFQLATRLPDYRRHLLNQPEIKDLDRKNPVDLFDYLLANPLRYAINGNRPRQLIVIDALDETLQNGQSVLTELIASQLSKLPDWLGWVVTSRPESAIRGQLEQFGLHEINADDPRNQDDVETYIQHWLPTLGLEQTDLIHAQQQILTAAQGNFLYVRQLQTAIQQNIIDIKHLNDLPKGLSALYLREFKYRFPDAYNYEQELLPVLEILVASSRPIPTSDIETLLNYSKRQRAKVIERLGSYLTVTDQGVALFHKSLQDWLLDEKSAGADYFVEVNKGHQVLGKVLWEQFTQTEDLVSCLDSYMALELPEQLSHWSDEELLRLINFDAINQYVKKIIEVIELENQPSRHSQQEAWGWFGIRLHDLCFGPDNLKTADFLYLVARFFHHIAQYTDGETFLRRSLAIREHNLESEHINIAESLNELAILLSDKGSFAEVKMLYERALAIREKLLGPNHVAVAESFNNLAQHLSDRSSHEDFELVISLQKRAVEIWENDSESDQQDLATGLSNLSLLIAHAGTLEAIAKAKPFCERALLIRENSLGSDVRSNNNLASGLKSRPRSCPYALVVRRSGV
jgi:tetratricopeptide (TPR) repeat protein